MREYHESEFDSPEIGIGSRVKVLEGGKGSKIGSVIQIDDGWYEVDFGKWSAAYSLSEMERIY